MTSRDDLALDGLLRDVIPPPDPHGRADARARLLASIDACDPAHRPTITRGSGPPVRTSSTPVRPAASPTRRSLAAALVLAVVVLVAIAIAWQMRLAVSTPLPIIGSGENAVTLYGDGNISCPTHVADDESLPVGTVEYHPGKGELRVIVTLTDAAPDGDYAVELWSQESCHIEADLPRGPWGRDVQRLSLTTDGHGAGELEHVFTGIEPGAYGVNVNLVTEIGLDDPRHREIGAATFTEVVVDSNGGG